MIETISSFNHFNKLKRILNFSEIEIPKIDQIIELILQMSFSELFRNIQNGDEKNCCSQMCVQMWCLAKVGHT